MSAATADIQARVAEINRETLIFKALRNCEPGNKRGNTSKCWQLDRHTLLESATMHIVGHKSAAEIRQLLAERYDGAKVSERVLSTWLRSIRKAYGAEYDKYLAEMEANEAIAFKSGDLVAVLAIVMAAVAPKFVAFSKALDIQSFENKDGHLIMRFLTIMTDAAKVQAEARRTEAQTQNYLLKLREALSVAGDEDRKPIDREQAQQQVMALLNEAMGLRGAA